VERPVMGGSLLRLGHGGPKNIQSRTCPSRAGFEGFLLLLLKAGVLCTQAHKSWQTASGSYPALLFPQAWRTKHKCINTVS